MPRPTKMDEVGVIYFIESPEQDAVKIGYSSGPASGRLAALQTGNPEPLILMGTIRATYGAEQALHAGLRSQRLRLEWYPQKDGIWMFVNELMDEGLDRCMDWLLENHPTAADVETLEEAQLHCRPVTADEMTELIAESFVATP